MRRKAEDIGSKVVWLRPEGRGVRMLIVVAPTAVPTISNALLRAAEILTLDNGVKPEHLMKMFSKLKEEIEDFMEEVKGITSALEKSKKTLEEYSTSPVVGPVSEADPYVFRVVGMWDPGTTGQTIDDLAQSLKEAGLDPQIERR